MLLSITLEQTKDANYKASDLGFLLHKNPFNVHEFNLSFGKAHVFYPQATDEKCTATLFAELDGIDIVKNYRMPKGSSRELKQYVNDRPYTVNSFFTVALSRVYRSAINGTCVKQPELVTQELPLTVSLPVLPSRGGENLIRNLFEPLGYEVSIDQYDFDAQLPECGASPYFKVTLKQTIVLSDLLTHLYVLIPVLDNDKHYWVGFDEVEKLIRNGKSWIPNHPAKDLIVARYLKKQGSLTRKALAEFEVEETILDQIEEAVVDEALEQERQSQASEDKLEKKVRLNDLRIQKIVETINSLDVSTIMDLGCGEGKYLREYLKIHKLNKITGIEVSPSVLDKAEQRLKIDRMPERVREKLYLLQGSLTYKDKRLKNTDLATCIEVIEHIDEDRLDAFAESLFGFSKPKYVIITTPNVEFNVTFENMSEGKLRHSDHRFEWDRTTFQNWCEVICEKYNYTVTYDSIGEEHPEFGAPTQMGLFRIR
jgi:3' terminal RNA ribose 2'-O-methyltransferase Hen1